MIYWGICYRNVKHQLTRERVGGWGRVIGMEVSLKHCEKHHLDMILGQRVDLLILEGFMGERKWEVMREWPSRNGGWENSCSVYVSLAGREGLWVSWVCAVQHGSHWSHMTISPWNVAGLNWDGIAHVKHKLDFRLSVKYNVKDLMDHLYLTTYEIIKNLTY